MNLHANAALSWSGRRRLCELVVDEGWTVGSCIRAATERSLCDPLIRAAWFSAAGVPRGNG